MKSPQKSHDVLICGAGPVGLVLGIELLRLGVSVRLIDKRLHPDTYSKALSLNSATLELLDELGIIDSILTNSYLNQEIQIHWNDRPIHTLSLSSVPSKFPYFAMIPQYKTEYFLRECFKKLGGIIERGKELIDLQQVSDHVLVTESDLPTGSKKKQNYTFVVGCDGSRSTVRGLSEIGFSGHDFGISIAMIDTKTNWGKHTNKMIYSVTERRFAIQIPMTDGIHRIVISVSGPFNRDRTWQHKDFRELLNDMGLDNLRIGQPIWSTSAPIFNRLAEKFHSGRILLAGDAAHLFSPIGGQGLNTGVQDAHSLAWRLKKCIESSDMFKLLKTYSDERRNYALKIMEWTDNLTRLITRIDRNKNGTLSYFLSENRNNLYLSKILPELLSGEKDNSFERYPEKA